MCGNVGEDGTKEVAEWMDPIREFDYVFTDRELQEIIGLMVRGGRNPRRDGKAKTKHRKKHVREEQAKKKTWDDEGIKRVERTDAMHHRGMAAAANVLRTTLSCFLHRP